jgi:hypothetical protein
MVRRLPCAGAYSRARGELARPYSQPIPAYRSRICAPPSHARISRPSDLLLLRKSEEKRTEAKGEQNVQIDLLVQHSRRPGLGLVADADTARGSGQRLRAQLVSRTGRRVPPVRHGAVPGRLFRAVPQRLPLERLPSGLLAWSMGTLSQHPVSRSPARRWLEAVRTSTLQRRGLTAQPSQRRSCVAAQR